ncbi:uncharacterized protein LOC121862085 isoform X2 [Homarus americanus]|uniref:uncharacterized protein LOC121862085 isoform X2 n=1 Tax=Homarus americanus TaxID=6706 RepID=UPI001C46794E|nr:uncharacterized protein LOC121862085 isoform X2 [Homarus americanus]
MCLHRHPHSWHHQRSALMYGPGPDYPNSPHFMILPWSVIFILCCFYLYNTIYILLLITRDDFPTEDSLANLRTSLAKTIFLLLINLIILFTSPAYNPVIFGISWIFMFPLSFGGLAWDLQRKMWMTIPGLPRHSPHRNQIINYPHYEAMLNPQPGSNPSPGGITLDCAQMGNIAFSAGNLQ